MTQSNEMPKEIYAIKGKDHDTSITFRFWHETKRQGSTKYIRHDIAGLSDAKQLERDLMAYGQSFSIDGKRIDPHDVFIDPPIENNGDALNSLRLLKQGMDTYGYPEQPDIDKHIAIIARALTPPQSPNRAVLDAIDITKMKCVVPDDIDESNSGDIREQAHCSGYNQAIDDVIAALKQSTAKDGV